MKVKKIEGIIFTAFFERLYEASTAKADEGASRGPFSCSVIASNAEEAMQKVKAAFPGEVINSLFAERDFGGGVVRTKTIVL